MGLSIRGYARHRGVSEAAVRKAIKAGRITLGSDQTLDPYKADQEWKANTARSLESFKDIPKQTSETFEDTLRDQGVPKTETTFMQAKTANEVLKAQTNKVRLQQLKGDLIDRSRVLSHVFKLARMERDAWITWPARVAASLAAELGVDPSLLQGALERYVREHLSELSEFKIGTL
jgi:hypothetical protein